MPAPHKWPANRFSDGFSSAGENPMLTQFIMHLCPLISCLDYTAASESMGLTRKFLHQLKMFFFPKAPASPISKSLLDCLKLLAL